MQIIELQKKAVDRYLAGFNCSESVLLTLTENIDDLGSCIPKIASGFGGGLGRAGLICGCIISAIMVLGLKYGRKDTLSKNDDLNNMVNKFCDEFKARFHSLNCKELIGLDLKTAAGRKMFEELKIREKKCANIISCTVEITESIKN